MKGGKNGQRARRKTKKISKIFSCIAINCSNVGNFEFNFDYIDFFKNLIYQ